MLIHIIADYGQGDLAFAEVVQRIKFFLPDAEPVLTPVPPFSTLAAGFCVAQLGLNEAPAGTLIYHNVAPRQDAEEARRDNEGERLAFARLPTGVRVVGVNAGEAFSFVRDAAEELRWASVPAEGSQFRSRDLFPQAAAAIALGQPDALSDAVEAGSIPDVPLGRVAYVDGYGNLKTTIRFAPGSAGPSSEVRVRIGESEQTAIQSDGTFAVEHGRMSFAPREQRLEGRAGRGYPLDGALPARRQRLGGIRAPSGRRRDRSVGFKLRGRMPEHAEEFTVGVEEEYQIVHAETRELCPRAASVLPEARSKVGDEVQPELYLSQIEIGTPVCRDLAEVRAEIVRLRREVIRAAERDGNRIAAAGTHPFSHWEEQQLTPRDRYLGIAEDYQQLAREQLIFGCHVHVGLRDREAAIQVMNRTRPWLSVMLALASNSPFWLGADTGYASFRTEIWRRWPMAGTPHVFASRAEYDALVEALVAAGGITDATKIYWDVRPSARFETLEFRVMDVCMTVDEAVMVAGLARALARTCYGQAVRDEPVSHARPELLRAAKWRAARYGLEAELIGAPSLALMPAREAVEKFLAFLRPSLEEQGEWEEVSALVRATAGRGTGAARQRAAYGRGGSLEDVVDLIVAETASGVA